MIQPLSIVWDFNPVFFSIGSLDIRYYGLMWALAVLIGAKFFDNFVNREGLPAKVSESIFIYGTLATILGARLGHCLLYVSMFFLFFLYSTVCFLGCFFVFLRRFFA